MLAINDLSTKLRSRRGDILDALARVIDRGWVVLGPEVRNFETEFAAYLRIPHCIGVANGTDAIELGLRALGVERNDRVITVANAGMYGSVAIRAIGAHPVFIDVDLDTQHATLDTVARGIEQGAKALILTHLYGRAVADTTTIVGLCAKHGVAVLEDCAQSHGAELSGRKVGTFGNAAAFSFYPTKNLGALGDGGALVTSDLSVAERVLKLRQYGWKEKYRADLANGRNSRLDEMQAAILSLLLTDLDEQNKRRREVGARYDAALRHPRVRLTKRGRADDVVHLYVVRCSDRDGLKRWLSDHKIGSDIHYPVPDYRQPALAQGADAGTWQSLPNTEALAAEILTLPCYPELSNADVDNVIRAVNNWPQ